MMRVAEELFVKRRDLVRSEQTLNEGVTTHLVQRLECLVSKILQLARSVSEERVDDRADCCALTEVLQRRVVHRETCEGQREHRSDRPPAE
jgi:hypothetical protein